VKKAITLQLIQKNELKTIQYENDL
jgi:hypothetical protein